MKFAKLTHHCLWSGLPLVGLLMAGHGLAAAQTPDTTRVVEIVLEARSANPGLQASRLRADASGERVAQAGALSDPLLSFGIMNRPLDNLAPDQPMTMNSLQLSQRLPWPGKRAANTQRADHLARAERLESAEAEVDLVARVKSVYYRIASIDRSIEVMTRTRDLLRNLQGVATARYAVGSGIQQDVLQAQVAVARLTADLTLMGENREAMTARLNALAGRAPTAPLGPLELPGPIGTIPPLESLFARAESARPALERARQRVQAADAGIESARLTGFPDVTVTVGYAQRPRFDDFATVMLGVNLPVWGASRQRPYRREMEAMRASAAAEERAIVEETFARLQELRAQAVRARQLLELYRTSVLPQARAAVESSLSAYQVGKVDYMTLMTNQMTVNEYELELIRLAADYQTAVAGIEALTSPATGGGE